MAEVRLENVSKSFADVEVIRELDLTIRDGEFFTVLGPSGCGKSTILNMVAGLVPVTGGSIYFDDLEVNDLSPKDRDVAMVFQSYALYPHMTVFENIAFPLKMKKYDKKSIGHEVERVAAILGLEDQLRRKPKELSGGQRQRVALGRAIVRKPKVFLMDEPLSNLDARLRVEMRAELKRLHRELKTTVIYVTHDQSEAMGLSDRIAILNHGLPQQCDPPLAIYERPINRFVAGFIGSPSMNFIEADLISDDPLRVRCNDTVFEPLVDSPPRGKKVVLGIRPEDIHVSKAERTGIEAITELVELDGPALWVDMIWDNKRLKGRASVKEGISPGERVFLKFSHERIHTFDSDSGERL